MKITVKEARQLAKWLDGIVRTEHSCKTRSMRAFWRDVQNRMTSPFCYSDAAEKCFKDYWKRTEKITVAAKIRIVTTK